MEPKLTAQGEYGWQVAADIFLAGAGAGAYTWAVACDLTGRAPVLARLGVCLGFPLVLCAALFLWSHLGVKDRALLALCNPRTSWVARGTYILGGFSLLAAIHAGAWLWPLGWLDDHEAPRRLLGGANLVLALLTMTYSGLLLGASRSISLWSTAVVPVLFVVSALATGAMAAVLAGAAASAVGVEALSMSPSLAAKVAALNVVLLGVQALAMVFHLHAAHRTTESRASASLMLRGPLAGIFWLGAVGLGTAVPLGVGIAAAASILAEGAQPLPMPQLVVGALCGLAGGFCLRYVVLASGVRAPLRAGGIEYAFPQPPARAR